MIDLNSNIRKQSVPKTNANEKAKGGSFSGKGRKQMTPAQLECTLVLLHLSRQGGKANSFHSSKDLDNWGFV